MRFKLPNLEAAFETWRQGALVYLSEPDGSDSFVRPAAFVFVIPGGFAWVEPSYADPDGASSPAYHERTGKVEVRNKGFIFRFDDGQAAVYPANADDQAMLDDLRPLNWFAEHLKENGLQWQAERERVRALVAHD